MKDANVGIIDLERFSQEDRVENEVKEKVKGDRDDENENIDPRPMPHFQGVFQINNHNQNGRHEKTKMLNIVDRQARRLGAGDEAQIREEEDHRCRDGPVHSTLNEDLSIEKLVSLTGAIATKDRFEKRWFHSVTYR